MNFDIFANVRVLSAMPNELKTSEWSASRYHKICSFSVGILF